MLSGGVDPSRPGQTGAEFQDNHSQWFLVFKATSHKAVEVLNIFVANNLKYGKDV